MTMEAKELRIGNYVYENDKFKTINSISNPQAKDYSKIHPIPLTEEWLLKFGFKKQNGYPYRFLYGYLKIINGNFFFKYHNVDVEILYVHQLQNLYFALTNKELTTK